MKSNALLLKVMLPAIICFILIRIIEIPFSYYPLSFGLIIGLANWNFHKYRSIFGVLLSVFVSYLSFFVGYISFAITGKMFDFMNGDSGSVLGLTISVYIIAPLILFLLYNFVLNIPKIKSTVVVILISIILLVLQNYFFYSREFNKESINSFTGWQVIMALALQFIIYQKELKALCKP